MPESYAQFSTAESTSEYMTRTQHALVSIRFLLSLAVSISPGSVNLARTLRSTHWCQAFLLTLTNDSVNLARRISYAEVVYSTEAVRL